MTAGARARAAGAAAPVRPDWRRRALPDLLAEHGLEDVPEADFPNDGWSGSRFTIVQPWPGERFVVKRTSPRRDWIVDATRDEALREAWVADRRMALPEPLWIPYLGAAADPDDAHGAAILSPDLSHALLAWERPGHDPVVGAAVLDVVVAALARLHAMPWAAISEAATAAGDPWPWCPLRERLLLLAPPSAARYARAGNPVGARFLAGWAAFERHAPEAARDLVRRLSSDPTPLLDALDRLPATGLHGDLKLANVALTPDGRVGFIDWQMTTLAPVAVELGWLLVSNSASLPFEPEVLLARYRLALQLVERRPLRVRDPRTFTSAAPVGLPTERLESAGFPSLSADEVVGDWAAQLDLAWVVGLLLRGWRKGLDADRDARIGSGATAADDLAAWCVRAVEAAGRRL